MLERAAPTLRASPAALPALVALGLLVALGASEAGFFPVGTDARPGIGWYSAALLALALLAVCVVALGLPRSLPRPVLAAIGLLAAYTAWGYLSIAWADQQGEALDGANRTAMYLVLFSLFALWPVEARTALALMGLLGLGIAGLGLVELLRANGSAEPLGYFIDARLAEPAGYINANVALWTIGAFACLALAHAREAPVVLRGPALGGAGLLSALALMGQSRGWFLALPLAVLFFVAFAPGRARALAAAVAVALGVLLASGPILAVHDEFTPGGFDGLLADATGAILSVTGVLTLIGLAAALVERRVRIEERLGRLIGGAIACGVGLVVVVGVAASAGWPGDDVRDAWNDFKEGGEAPRAGSDRLGAAGTNRYDFWSVAWELFEEKPIHGIGIENFQQEYLRRGDSTERPRYPHSLELGVLSQTGLVGGLLLGGALGAALLAALRTARRGPPARAAAAAGCAVVFAYWLAHASVDWFWEFPALTGTALAMLGLATAVDRPAEYTAGSGPGRRRLPLVAAALAGLGLVLALGAVWLSERDIARATEGWPRDPGAAFDRLERAGDLNPLSPRPPLYAAFIALQLGDKQRAEREFRDAREREPGGVFTLLELGALASERGDRREALALVEEATARSPRDRIVLESLLTLSEGRRLRTGPLNRRILRRTRARAD